MPSGEIEPKKNTFTHAFTANVYTVAVFPGSWMLPWIAHLDAVTPELVFEGAASTYLRRLGRRKNSDGVNACVNVFFLGSRG